MMPKYTLVKTINADGKSPLFYFEGPSDATEPTDDWITDNSELLQKDTGVRKFKKGNTWETIASSGDEGGEGGSGGGQFVVTFSGVDLEEGTVESADKTLAQIAEAVAAGKQVIGFVSSEDTANLWMPLINAAVEDDNAFFQFGASLGDATFSIMYGNDGGEPQIEFQVIELINRNDVLENTSLIVNLTLDGTGETPVLVGNKTYGDIKEAQFAGKHVVLKGSLEDKGDFAASVIDAVYDAEENVVAITFASVGKLASTGGLASDYVTIAAE